MQINDTKSLTRLTNTHSASPAENPIPDLTKRLSGDCGSKPQLALGK
jgi:hypothetical protein